jgi:hypothetical protein
MGVGVFFEICAEIANAGYHGSGTSKENPTTDLFQDIAQGNRFLPVEPIQLAAIKELADEAHLDITQGDIPGEEAAKSFLREVSKLLDPSQRVALLNCLGFDQPWALQSMSDQPKKAGKFSSTARAVVSLMGVR